MTKRLPVVLAFVIMPILPAGVPPTDAAVLPLNACTSEALRALINGAVSGDVLLLPACTIPVAGAPGDDANVSGDFDIATSITLQGVGSDATVLDGGGLDRVLDIRPGATVTLANLTIRNGAGQVTDPGGGLRNAGATTLINVRVTRNSTLGASNSGGGGIFNVGSLTILRSVLAANTAAGNGGGLRTEEAGVAVIESSEIVGNSAGINGGGLETVGTGSLTVRDTTIADNIAGSNGGAINNGESGTLFVERSTLSGNIAGSNGGGLQNVQSATATVVNSTIAYNTGSFIGGGIRTSGPALTLVNTTIARNTDASGSVLGAGGVAALAGTVILRNSVVADNTIGGATPAPQADVSGTLAENSSTFVGTTDGAAHLGRLQDNGGPTFTMAPFPGSPLIDTGNNTLATAEGLTTDQRGAGFARIVDGDANGTATVDRGAVEVTPSTGPANVAILFLSRLAPAPADTVVLGILIRAPGRTIVGGAALFDGFDISQPLVGCPLVAGTLVTGEQVITCTFPASVLPPGGHTFSLFLDLDDGTTLTDTATIGG